MIPKYRCSCNNRARSRAKTLLTTTPHIRGINPLSCVEKLRVGGWENKEEVVEVQLILRIMRDRHC
jgi:hypothetical protein